MVAAPPVVEHRQGLDHDLIKQEVALMGNATVVPLTSLDTAQLAAAGYLARYTGRTRQAYTDDLRLFFTWCEQRSLPVLEAQRPHLELNGRRPLYPRPSLIPLTYARTFSTSSGARPAKSARSSGSTPEPGPPPTEVAASSGPLAARFQESRLART